VAAVDLSQPYLHKQLIAYIGSKRRLLPALHAAFARLQSRHRIETFLDPFAGTGVVARLARAMGYRVSAGDLEPYSWVINRCHLGIELSELDGLFAAEGGVASMLSFLMSAADREAYVARHYAPRTTAQADYRRERLFYTTENARIIDRVREGIESLHPGFDLGERDLSRKVALLAPLLYEAATHTNTSGVFKAYHKGFGGHGGDALPRIMTAIRPRPPVLIDALRPAEVCSLEATEFVRGRTADLCYLDPPYNQHQYGSNYHLLNTIALWDKPPVNDTIGRDGRLVDRAAIRKDWQRTRSRFCSRAGAPGALSAVLAALDARLIVLSYDTSGMMSADHLLDILAEHGRVELHAVNRVLNPGGRQSPTRRTHTGELLWVVERGAETGRAARADVAAVLLDRELASLGRLRYVPERLEERFRCGPGWVELAPGLSVPAPDLHRVELPLDRLKGLPAGEKRSLVERLEHCACRDGEEELAVLIRLLSRPSAARRRARERRLLQLLRRLAHPRYVGVLARFLGQLRVLAESQPVEFAHLTDALEGLERLAERRLAG
jgi:adenine-specific DNA-methyltransferase